MLNEETTSCETNWLDIFTFNIVTKGFPTCSWKEEMISVVILTSVAASRSSFASSSSNTQFAVGSVTSSKEWHQQEGQ